MRMAKVEELRKEIEILSQNHEREVDRKDAIIQMLDRDLEDAEEQYQLALRGHMQVVESLLDLQYMRMKALQEEFNTNLKALEEEFETWAALPCAPARAHDASQIAGRQDQLGEREPGAPCGWERGLGFQTLNPPRVGQREAGRGARSGCGLALTAGAPRCGLQGADGDRERAQPAEEGHARHDGGHGAGVSGRRERGQARV